jgi:superfamily I DNA and/or RNA helicase
MSILFRRSPALPEQYRMNTHIMRLANPKYKGLVAHESTEDRETAFNIVDFITNAYPKVNTIDSGEARRLIIREPRPRNAFILNHEVGLDEVAGMSSRLNKTSFIITVDFIKKLIDDGFKGKQICVIVFYRGQENLYERWKSIAAVKTPEIAAVTCGTVEKIYGKEYDITIVDVVATRSLGFLREDDRTLTASSRARHGLVFVADLRMLERDLQYPSSFIGKTFRTLRRVYAFTTLTQKHIDQLRTFDQVLEE